MTNFTRRDLTPTEELVSNYEGFIEDLSDGYDMGISEYTNDISCRSRLEELKDDSEVRTLWRRVQQADQRLKNLLKPTKGCIFGRYPETHFWYWGYPPGSPELEEDLRKMGAL